MPQLRADQLRAGDGIEMPRHERLNELVVVDTLVLAGPLVRVNFTGHSWHRIYNIADQLQVETELVEGMTLPMLAHANYPHEPGRLYDCPACDRRCWCDAAHWTTECVFEGAHAWSWVRVEGQDTGWHEVGEEERYSDHGDVGGDGQVSKSLGRRWQRRMPVEPARWQVVDIYVYELWEKPPTYTTERHEYQVQRHYTECTDPGDPGGTELGGGVDYDSIPLSEGSRRAIIDAAGIDDVLTLAQANQ